MSRSSDTILSDWGTGSALFLLKGLDWASARNIGEVICRGRERRGWTGEALVVVVWEGGGNVEDVRVIEKVVRSYLKGDDSGGGGGGGRSRGVEE